MALSLQDVMMRRLTPTQEPRQKKSPEMPVDIGPYRPFGKRPVILAASANQLTTGTPLIPSSPEDAADISAQQRQQYAAQKGLPTFRDAADALSHGYIGKPFTDPDGNTIMAAPSTKLGAPNMNAVNKMSDPGAMSFGDDSGGLSAADILTGGGGEVEEGIKSGQGVFRPSPKGAVQTEIGKALYQDREQYDRLRQLQHAYRPEYLNKNHILKMWMTSQKAGWGGEGVVGSLLGQASLEDKAQLADFQKNRALSLHVFNDALKSQTGTAVSPGEAQRIAATLPTVGSGPMFGLLNGDDPVSFAAKMDENLRYMRRAITRQSYYLKKGIPLNLKNRDGGFKIFDDTFDPNDPETKDAILTRATELAKEGRDPAYISDTLREEFELNGPNPEQ